MASHATGPRSIVRLAYGFHNTDFEEDIPDLQTRRAGVGFERQVTTSGWFRVGYAYRYGNPRPTTGELRTEIQHIDIGGRYEGQHTTLTFSGTPTSASQSDETFFPMLGSVVLDRAIGRSVRITGAYGRALQFVAPFPDPFLGETYGLSFRASLGQRVILTTQGIYGRGTRGLRLDDLTYENSAGSVRVRFEVSPALQIVSGYTYWRYLFEQGQELPGVITSARYRHTVRFGIIYRLALVGQRR